MQGEASSEASPSCRILFLVGQPAGIPQPPARPYQHGRMGYHASRGKDPLLASRSLSSDGKGANRSRFWAALQTWVVRIFFQGVVGPGRGAVGVAVLAPGFVAQLRRLGSGAGGSPGVGSRGYSNGVATTFQRQWGLIPLSTIFISSPVSTFSLKIANRCSVPAWPMRR